MKVAVHSFQLLALGLAGSFAAAQVTNSSSVSTTTAHFANTTVLSNFTSSLINLNTNATATLTSLASKALLTTTIVSGSKASDVSGVLSGSGAAGQDRNAAVSILGVSSQLVPGVVTSGKDAAAGTLSTSHVIVTQMITVTAPLCGPGAPTGLAAAGSGTGISRPKASGAGSNSGKSSGSASGDSKSPDAYTGSTLLPAVHWEHPVDDLANLAPGSSLKLYYTSDGVSDPALEHLFASLDATLQYNVVVLDHSIFVSSTSCGKDGIVVGFTTQAAFEYACKAWSAVDDFVLVTYTDGCGASDDQRTFWLIDSVSCSAGSKSIVAKVTREIAIEDALDGVDLVWGTYYPPGSKGPGSSDGSSVGANGGAGGSGSGSGSGSGGSGNFGSSGSGSGASGTSNGSGSSNGGSGRSSGGSSGSLSGGSSGGSTGGSSSGRIDTGSFCGNAPSATIDGFPAAACGAPDFDLQLDNAIGYLDFTPSGYANSVKDFVPDASFDEQELTDDDASIIQRRGTIQKRGFWGWIKKAVSTAVKVVVKVATAPARIVAAAVKAIPVVGNLIASATQFNPTVSGGSDISLGPNNNDQSPWGAAAMIYSKASSSSGKTQADIALYCVNCGLKGRVNLAGAAKWNLLDGLHGLNANINANLEAGLNLGMVATAMFSDTKTKSLINQALPSLGVSVKGIFSAGVFVGVDAVAKLDVTATGQALIGVTMLIPNFQANLNLLDSGSAEKSGITGFTPEFKKTFEASGSIAAAARLSLPISLNVGIQIVPLNFKKSLALIEEPSLYGNVTFAASTENAPAASETCNNGFEYFANLQNDVKFDFFGVKTLNLHHYDSPPLLKGCKLLGGGAPATPGSDAGSGTGTGAGTGSEGTGSGGSGTGPGSSGTGSSDSDGSNLGGSSTDGSTGTPGSDNSDNSSGTPGTGSSGSTPTGPSNEGESPTPSTGEGNGGTKTGNTGNTGNTGDSDGTATTTPPASGDNNNNNPEGSTPEARRKRATSGATKQLDSAGATEIADDDMPIFDSNPNDTSDSDPDPSPSASSDPNSAEYQADSAKALDQAASASGQNGFSYISVTEMHGAFGLVPGEDGNLYAGAPPSPGTSSDSSSLFSTLDGSEVVGDDSSRVLHYYPDTMAAYNASRLRLSDEDHIPKTADFVVLRAIDFEGDAGAGSPDLLFAADTKGNTFSLVLCDFENGADSKVFVVSGDEGVENLMSGRLTYTVTGGLATGCDPIALVIGK